MRYWKNEIPTEEVWLPDGRKIILDFWETRGHGYLCTDVGFINNQIESAIANHVGGWVASTQDEYESALKKKQTSPTAQSSQRWFRRDPSMSIRVQSSEAAGSVAGKRGIEVPSQPRPDPIRVPTPEQMRPRKGPIPKEAII